MKTLMAVLMLLVSTSLLADPYSIALKHANCNASFNKDCDPQVYAVNKVSVPESRTLELMGLGLALMGLGLTAIDLGRVLKRNTQT